MTNSSASTPAPSHFHGDMAGRYDERNSKLADIAANMHFLIRLVLHDLPTDARILCVGAGTGAEILSLAHANPGWTFVGVDPSAGMLEVCRDKLARANVLDRCDLVVGYVDDVEADAQFDAVVSVLVAHFVGRDDRPAFYQSIRDRLKPGGYFVSTEISADLDAAEFPAQLQNWERVQALMGATPETLHTLPDVLRNTLSVLSPLGTENLLREARFAEPIHFFQAFLIHGWHSRK